MAHYLLKRFLLTLPALWLVLTLVFLMIHIVPGDPVEQMLGEGAAPGQLTQLRHVLDRKSTRLNSSHDQISYAVFCLKKKKKLLNALRQARANKISQRVN